MSTSPHKIWIAVAVAVGVWLFIWSTKSTPAPPTPPVAHAIKDRSNRPADSVILYINGIRLESDNVFVVPRTGNAFELHASAENLSLSNLSNVWLSVGVTTHLTNFFSLGSWSLIDSPGQDRGRIAYFSFHTQYVMPPTVVRSFPTLSMNLSNLLAFGGRIELGSGTNPLARSRVHFLFGSNFVDTVHLTGRNAENFLRQRAGTNYSPDLLIVGRE